MGCGALECGEGWNAGERNTKEYEEHEEHTGYDWEYDLNGIPGFRIPPD
jgi:hypothetical protein